MDKKLSGKESRELAQASRNHEVPCKISMRSQAVSFLQKPWISVPKYNEELGIRNEELGMKSVIIQ